MAQTIFYDSSSVTASDELGGGGGTVVSGTLASMTLGVSSMELGTTVDLTGQILNQPVWFEAIPGERHLFEVSGFFPSASTCSRLDLVGGPDSTQTNKKWGIGGKRKTLQGDPLHTDIENARSGWVYSFDGGTTNKEYPITTTMVFPNVGDVVNGNIILRGTGLSKPKITWTGDFNGLDLQSSVTNLEDLDFENLNPLSPTAVGIMSSTNGYRVSLERCTITSPGSALVLVLGMIRSLSCHYKSQGLAGALVNINSPTSCLFLGGSITGNISGGDGVFFGVGANNHIQLIGVTISTTGSVFTKGVSTVFSGNNSSYLVKNCVITHNAIRQGPAFNIWNPPSENIRFTVINNIFANATAGILRQGGVNLHETENFMNDYNAFYNITGVEVHSNLGGMGPNSIIVPSDPFTDAANGDFSLNDIVDGGGLLKTSGLVY